MAVIKGLIIRSISGFYYVEAADAVYECKAKGSFRKKNITPLTGDEVEIETVENKGTVINVLPRKNFLTRPPVANIDKIFIISSADKPRPNLFVIDKLSAFAVFHKIEPVIVFSKSDLDDVTELADIYIAAGFKVYTCSSVTGEGLCELRKEMSGCLCAFTGNSGVGKSSILNFLMPELGLETNGISEKLGRGKHTTRSVSLYRFDGGYVADTPGFSSLEFEKLTEIITKEELPDCFPEFRPFVDDCRFSVSCSHTGDKGCAVAAAVNDGRIPLTRYESYLRMYSEVKDIKKWEQNKNK